MTRFGLWAAAMALALAGHAPGAEADGVSHNLVPADIFRLQWASDPEISPDGRHVVYVRNGADVMTDTIRKTLWIIDTSTGAQSPLTDGTGSEPRWAPDGGRVAFVAPGEGGSHQILVHWLSTGRTARIAVLPEGPSDLAWSPDGKTIAFTMLKGEPGETIGEAPPKPEGAKWAPAIQVITDVNYRADGEGYLHKGHHHLYMVDADGGAPRQLTFGATDDRGVLSWSPDGRSIVFTAKREADWEREPVLTGLYEVDLVGFGVRPLTHGRGAYAEAQVSPDGKLIAYVGADDHRRGYEDSRLIVMNRDGSGQRVLTGALDRAVFNPHWSHDGRSLYVSYDDHGRAVLVRISLAGAVTPVAEDLGGGDGKLPYSASMPLGHAGLFSVADDGVAAVTMGSATAPTEVALVSGGRKRSLTALNDMLFREKTPSKAEARHVASSVGGLPIEYWMLTPASYDAARKYPLILEIHGGPFASYGPVWSLEDQLFASAGYVVVYANPRGSTSYGDKFANLIHDDYPSQDYDDLMSVVDDAIAHGPADPNQLYVTGGSGGGALTAWIVGKTHRFKAAVSQKPVTNWISEGLSSDYYIVILQDWFAKMPWEEPQEYWRRSPLSLVGNVTTPTMLIVGSDDHRTPATESEQYYQALQLRHVPTALLKTPGASHLVESPSQTATRVSAILAWFQRYGGR